MLQPIPKPRCPSKYRTYASPLTERYGSEGMRRLWSEYNKRVTWRTVWANLLFVQRDPLGIPNSIVECATELIPYVDIPAALVEEEHTKHDLVAELAVYRRQMNAALSTSGECLHYGATSSDIEDNADAMLIKEALFMLEPSFVILFSWLIQRIESLAEVLTPAYTHLQAAEYTTFGFRLAVHAHEFLRCWRDLHSLACAYEGKGLRGAVGTASSQRFLGRLSPRGFLAMERTFCRNLGLLPPVATTQVSSRIQELALVQALARLAAVAHKFGLDLRVLASSPFGEVGQSASPGQVGSSAMPHKRNPIGAERLCGLTRYLASLERNFWDNAAVTVLERTLDDSSNRRLALPQLFLVTDEVINQAAALVRDWAPVAPAEPANALLMFGVLFSCLRQLGWTYERAQSVLRDLSRLQPAPSVEQVQAFLAPLLSGDGQQQVLVAQALDPQNQLGYIGQFIEDVLKELRVVVEPAADD